MRGDVKNPGHKYHRLAGRVFVFAIAVAMGIAVSSLMPEVIETVRGTFGLGAAPNDTETASDVAQHRGATAANDEPSAVIDLTDAQIEIVGIALAPVQDGTLITRITVPGTIVPHADRIARVSVRLFGTIAELRKKLGDTVAKDEVVAVIDSREVANAKSEYLAARLTSVLNQDLYERDKQLWDRHVIAEQIVLRSRSAAAQAKMNVDIARQKLFAIGLTERDIAALPAQPESALRFQDVQSPIAGRVVDRKVDLGAAVGRDQLETELFTIADLERVWVDLAIGPSDLPLVREGQGVAVTAHGLSERALGRIVFISPMVDRETHSARVVAEIGNADGNWRPGSLVHCSVAIAERLISLAVPTSAIQTVGPDRVVFVRTTQGFEKRIVTLGQSDERITEVLAGVQAGDIIAVTNTFALKAEFLKSLAED